MANSNVILLKENYMTLEKDIKNTSSDILQEDIPKVPPRILIKHNINKSEQESSYIYHIMVVITCCMFMGIFVYLYFNSESLTNMNFENTDDNGLYTENYVKNTLVPSLKRNSVVTNPQKDLDTYISNVKAGFGSSIVIEVTMQNAANAQGFNKENYIYNLCRTASFSKLLNKLNSITYVFINPLGFQINSVRLSKDECEKI